MEHHWISFSTTASPLAKIRGCAWPYFENASKIVKFLLIWKLFRCTISNGLLGLGVNKNYFPKIWSYFKVSNFTIVNLLLDITGSWWPIIRFLYSYFDIILLKHLFSFSRFLPTWKLRFLKVFLTMKEVLLVIVFILIYCLTSQRSARSIKCSSIL